MTITHSLTHSMMVKIFRELERRMDAQNEELEVFKEEHSLAAKHHTRELLLPLKL